MKQLTTEIKSKWINSKNQMVFLFSLYVITGILIVSNTTCFGQGISAQAKYQTIDVEFLQRFRINDKPIRILVEAHISNNYLIDTGGWNEEVRPGVQIKDMFTKEIINTSINYFSLITMMQYLDIKNMNLQMSNISSLEDNVLSDSLRFKDFNRKESMEYLTAFLSYHIIFEQKDDGFIEIQIDKVPFPKKEPIERIGTYKIHLAGLFTLVNRNFNLKVFPFQ